MRSDQSAVEVAGAYDSARPIRRPPSIAPGDAADPADDRRGERLEAGLEADEMEDLAEVQAEHDAGGAREHRADEERGGDHAIDVDAHHRGGLAVVRGGAHRLPESACARR